MPARPWMVSNFAVLAASLVSVGCGPTGPSADTLVDTSTTDADTGTDTGGCELPSDAPVGPDTATITIRNDSAAPAYLLPNSAFGCNYGQIQIEVDGEPVKWDHPGVYALGCDDECGWGCSDGGSNGLIVNPGATAEVTWNGMVWATEPLSPECVALSMCDNPLTECEVRTGFSGEYTAVVELAQDCPGDDQEACPCAEDVCPLFVYEPQQFEVWQRIEASAVFPAGAEIVIPG